MTTAFPLAWPQGWPRTIRRARSRFDVTFDRARKELSSAIVRMGGQYPVISTNVELRRDGMPYASAKEPTDPGVAVYFLRDGRQMVFACDRWDLVRDNIRAIERTIEALRGIERWGASDMMERAFSAFEALPAPKSHWDILGIGPSRSRDDIDAAYRRQARAAHPDAGGSHSAMADLNAARDAALKEIGA